MFTVGLFSTHIPYIAFVFFYAFFFLFGIQKAHAGELSGTEKVSVVASCQVTETADEACICYFSTYCEHPVKKNISPPVATLKLLPGNALPEISVEFDFSRFSRPPPAA